MGQFWGRVCLSITRVLRGFELPKYWDNGRKPARKFLVGENTEEKLRASVTFKGAVPLNLEASVTFVRLTG